MIPRVQYNVHTSLFREKELFVSARAFKPKATHGDRLRILSFGCSIGDELASLRLFFPDAEIVGAEIDEPTFNIAKASVGHLATVVMSELGELQKRAPFDVIFALSSLCVNPLPGKIGDHLAFKQFEEVCALVDSLLADGGLLCLKNTSYLFKHTAVSRKYDILRSDIIDSCGFVDVFAPDGQPILSQCFTSLGTVPLLEAQNSVSSEWDLIDSLFVKRADAEANKTGIHPLNLSSPERPDSFHIQSSWSRSRAALVPPDVYSRAVVVVDHYTVLSDGTETMLEKRVARRFLVGEKADGVWVTLNTQPELSAVQWFNRLA